MRIAAFPHLGELQTTLDVPDEGARRAGFFSVREIVSAVCANIMERPCQDLSRRR
jgi:hypothetical protein